MPLHPEANDASDSRTDVAVERLTELTRVLDRETALVRELEETLVQQRAGVASSEADAVNESVDAIGRLLLSLTETRAARNDLVASLAGPGTPAIDRLESAIGASLPPELEAARARLRKAAESVAHQVAINHAVLRHAVEAGEAFLQALFSSTTDPPTVYAPTERREETAPGVLLNRRA